MDAKTRDQALKMAQRFKAEGRNFFEQIVTLRAEFGLTLEEAKEVHHEAEDGRKVTLSDRQGELADLLEADLAAEPA